MDLDQSADERRLRLLRLQLIETNDGLLLKRGRVVVKVQGAESAQMVQALLAIAADGEATRQELCEPFPPPVRPAVRELMEAMEARGLLTDASRPDDPPGREEPIDIFYWHFDKRASDVRRTFENARVTVLGVNCVSRQLVSALGQCGIDSVEVIDYPLLGNVRLFGEDGRVLDEQWPDRLPRPRSYREWLDATGGREAGCLVLTSDFGGQHLLRDWNRHCIHERIQFLPVVLQDLIGYIGPLVVPGESACLECLRARENSHMDDPDVRRAPEYVAYHGQVINAFHPSMASVLGDIAALELHKLYGQLMRSRLVGRLIEVNLLVPQLTERRVLKLPRCAACGTETKRSPVSQHKVAFMPGHEVAR
jgi:molybdopterin-synthase adenylyltransferase